MRFILLALIVTGLCERAACAAQRDHDSRQTRWRMALADRLRREGRADEESHIAAGKLPGGWSLEHAGELGLALRSRPEGVRLESVFDLALGRELLATNDLPIFDVTVRHVASKKEIHLQADRGWRRTATRRTRDGLELRWLEAADESLRGVTVLASAKADAKSHAWHWTLRAENQSTEWSVLRVVFPQVTLADLGERGAVFFPRGPGEVETNLWNRAFKYRGNYTDCWCSMQFMAAYQEAPADSVRVRISAAFPLTPALSRREREVGSQRLAQRGRESGSQRLSQLGRENGSRRLDQPSGARRVQTPPAVLPLPAGEGRGEGERQLRTSVTNSSSTHSPTPATTTGLYLATHDPLGTIKYVAVESDPATRTVRLFYEHPAPNMTAAGNDFELSGEAVWQLLRGDWFDAAQIYRAWARREASWWPQLKSGERLDTPRWMRELNVWALSGGAPSECVDKVKQFQQFLGVPAGFHWYNWHVVPFDNDYPHYFPTKTNVTQGVAELKSAGVYVMPYINGRLWDTHDRGAEDFQFTTVALPAATKQEDCTPCVESYGSKETSGEPVRLAVMCPATPLWQQKVGDIVLRLLGEVGTSAVYIDQVAAAAPRLCMDASHGHPLGGGDWWVKGYGQMLTAIREKMPPGTMLTTECNGEPFMRWFDGYLTWHWQHDGQVPAFPAVYGGAIQMFGRAYRGGDTKDLALRMKAGQQLVFGEQLGWIDPGVMNEKENAEFFRSLVRLRAKFNRYFAAGEMARSPKILGEMPTVKADWQWSKDWWVTTDAVLTGAWQLPKEKRLVLLFVNVSDQPVTAAFDFDARTYGLPAKRLKCLITRSDPSPPESHEFSAARHVVTVAPRQAQAWELRW
ncbi:MAG: hypothetical protein HYY24_23970 [Verrucomicrobia bacterium]|nr:hypothetical protein [Verrucomicrobiota bacterium]